jgi:hypothetical protein
LAFFEAAPLVSGALRLRVVVLAEALARGLVVLEVVEASES